MPLKAGAVKETSTDVGSRLSFPELLRSRFLGENPSIEQVRDAVLRAAPEDFPVLITGESGTGKDLIADLLHQGSSRAHLQPRVVAVGSLGETAWSELFGHRRGSFTGALNDHEGIFASAHGSTVILEDVVELSIKLQPLLLRAIERGMFRPMGAVNESYADVRPVSTTNVCLLSAIEAGRFRRDLYQRIAVLRIDIPPLREHIEDIRIYAPYFLEHARKGRGPARRLSESAFKVLFGYTWPGNVRELEHVLYCASVNADGPVIDDVDILPLLPRTVPAKTKSRIGRGAAAIDAETLFRTLKECRGNKREAARILGVCPNTVYALLRQYGDVVSSTD
jgi:DNA-binding NtrC family response regulator